MAQLVTKHRGQLRFVFQGSQQSAGYGDKSPRQGKGVRSRVVDHLKLIGQIGTLTDIRQCVTHLPNILGQLWIAIFAPHLLQSPRKGLLAKADLFTGRHLKQGQFLATSDRIYRTTGQ